MLQKQSSRVRASSFSPKCCEGALHSLEAIAVHKPFAEVGARVHMTRRARHFDVAIMLSILEVDRRLVR
eukprot:2669928-Pleurochrysis_carterae.AAC.4